MWRALVFVGLLCVAAFGAVWLAEHPGTVSIVWQGREVTTSLAVGLVGVMVAAIALAVLWWTFQGLIALPGRLGQGARRRRRARGLAALSRGLVAVGAGDLSTARRYAAEAERLAGNEPLALLLRAQTAQATGDRASAEGAFRRMLDHSETRVLGLRGLFLEARRDGDPRAARNAAEDALRLAPAATWANDAVLESYSAEGDWAGALRAVERRSSVGSANKAELRRQRAVLHAADALSRDARGDTDGALAAARDAVQLAPDLVPAAALAGRILSQRGDLKRAARIVETAWKSSEHPDLAAVYLNHRPGDAAADRLGRAETLARLSSWSPESRMAIARAAIEARELARAREVLRPLTEDGPTVRVCLMMAELAQAEGAPGRVREWLARAARAPRDKAWIADGVVSESWAPVSPVSGRFDAFVWDTPPVLLGGPHGEEAEFLDHAIETGEQDAPAPPATLPPSGEVGRQGVAEPVRGALDVLSPPAVPSAVPRPIPDGPLSESEVAQAPGSVVFPFSRGPDEPPAATDHADAVPANSTRPVPERAVG